MVETEVRGSGHARVRLRRGLQAQRGAGRINRMFLDFRPVTLLIGRAICRASSDVLRGWIYAGPEDL